MALTGGHGDVDLEDSAEGVIRSLSARLVPAGEEKAIRKFVREVISIQDLDKVTTVSMFYQKIRPIKRKYKMVPKKAAIRFVYRRMIEEGLIKPNAAIENYLITCPTRSLSGVLVITVFTSPYPKYGNKVQKFSCKHNCYYCPNEPGLPRSYLSDEPGVQRGKKHGWHPVNQFTARAFTLHVNGHHVDKIEILVLGGTWSEYPQEYQETFLRDIFYAANTFYDKTPRRSPKSLREEQKINESTSCRIIGLTLETRPDSIDAGEVQRMRLYGCTRVQIGIQHTDDRILKVINRGCTNADAIRATRLLKDAGFKIDFHLMPDLPTSTPEIDLKMFNYVLHSQDLQADQWKIYPCQVTPWTVIEKWAKEGKHVPYSNEVLADLLLKVKRQVHPWIRLNRVIRDIPNQYILAGNPVTNLRQIILERMRRMGIQCHCIRCREVRDKKGSYTDHVLVQREYKSSGAREIFISFESNDKRTIYGFCRLRLSKLAGVECKIPEIQGAALVRELHVYGKMRPVGDRRRGQLQKGVGRNGNDDDKEKAQHIGFGSRLMLRAEQISVKAGYRKIAVIAGIGTRQYYAKLGYKLEGTYMVKHFSLWNRTGERNRFYARSLLFLILIYLHYMILSARW
eukprot:jgi/Bigna1/85812/estExt_fgenesh1_pg.C_60181